MFDPSKDRSRYEVFENEMTWSQDAHGPPYKDFHIMRLGKVFRPYLKKSLS